MYLGIDVSKATLDVVLLPNTQSLKGRHRVFDNTPLGHEQLLSWLQSYGEVAFQVCLEATGTYAHPVARMLHESGYSVALVNPAQVHAFAKSQLKRAKTDKADALLIARFCALHQPPLWTPPAAEVDALQALSRRLDALQALSRRLDALEEMKRMEENRLESASDEVVRASLLDHIAYLQQHIATTKTQIQEHIGSHAHLREQSALLCSIPGIAASTAALLLAEVGAIESFAGARQVAAFAGLAPQLHQSGKSVRGQSRLCKVGSARLRKALYFPAMCALRYNPLLRAFAERLRAQGKPKMLILGAAMRKLLCLAYGVLKSKQPFDPNFANANP